MRRPLISGNWKMHHNHFEAIQLVQTLSYQIDADDHEAVYQQGPPQSLRVRCNGGGGCGGSHCHSPTSEPRRRRSVRTRALRSGSRL